MEIRIDKKLMYENECQNIQSSRNIMLGKEDIIWQLSSRHNEISKLIKLLTFLTKLPLQGSLIILIITGPRKVKVNVRYNTELNKYNYLQTRDVLVIFLSVSGA